MTVVWRPSERMVAWAMPYSYPQALDRRVASSVIRHLIPGALALAGAAGYINSVALGFFRTPVSHMTGAISYLGLDLAEGRMADLRASLTIVVGFLGGAVLAGAMIGAKKLLPGRRYGFAMVFEGLLLALATTLLVTRHRLGLPVVAMACGLQNAVASSYCGLVIRTTHVTGLVTDVGVMLGQALRHQQVEWRKLGFLAGLFLAFGTGGWIGAVVDLRLGPVALAVPAAGFVLAGAVFWWLAHLGRLRVQPACAA
jgi:uncharacterized membrane protein YoaK (UPF0700 family)